MLRKLLLVLGLLLLASLSAQAQDKVEVFGGYSYRYLHSSPSTNLNGWEIAAQYKFTDWLGGVADFDGHYGSSNGIGTSTYTYLFGPQISLPSRVSPFGRLLLGGAHISEASLGRSSFSMALGGGVDVVLFRDQFYWRVIQTDYLMTQFGSQAQNNFRASTGIVFRF
jgi:hypothetical protein